MGKSDKIYKDHLDLENIGLLTHDELEEKIAFLESVRSRYIGLVTHPTYSIAGNQITLSSAVAFLCSCEHYDENTRGKNMDVPSSSFTITNEKQPYYIIAKRTGEVAAWELVTSESLFAQPNVTLAMIITRIGSDFHITQMNTIGVGLPEKLNQRLIDKYRFERITGVRISTTSLDVEVTAGVIAYGANFHDVNQFITPTHQISLLVWNGSDWVEQSASSLNNTQYNGASGLQTLTNNHYVVNWLYRSVEQHEHVYSFLSRSQFNKLEQAINSNPPPIPPYVQAQAMFLGGVIYLKNNATPQYIIESTDVDLIEGGVDTHNDLASIQGGQAGEYYHLTQTEHTKVLDAINSNRLRYIEFDQNGDAFESGFLLDANDENDETVYLTEEI